MRTVRLACLLLIATCGFAQTLSQSPQPSRNFALDFTRPATANADPSASPFLLAMPAGDRAARTGRLPQFLADSKDGNTCYFIRSYIMKRESETGATHLDHVTTCTPKSRIRMKTKVKFTPAVEK